MLPNHILSAIPEPAPFLPPRTNIRFSAQSGLSDTHYGGIAIGDPSHGLQYQLWTAYTDSTGSVYLQAPNTPAFVQLPNVGAVWVALAFDQNARVFIAYAQANGSAFYYWFDSTIPGYRTTPLNGVVPRVFASLDDSRVLELNSSDVILAYVRTGTLYFRAQRDRFGVEYTLGAAPATLVQIGMNHGNRFQFAFQNVQGNSVLPPSEWNPGIGFNEPS
jgi:hypothetical protein